MRFLIALSCLALVSAAGTASAQNLVINEILFNPTGTDNPNEYVEIRNAGGATTLADIYLVGIEGDAGAPNPGDVQNIFALSGTLPAGAFLVFLQGSNTYVPAGSATVLTGVTGFGGAAGFSTDIGGDVENASVTFLLVEAPVAPALSDDIDVDDDGVLDGAVFSSWTILDSIGALDGDAGDFSYGAITFATGGVGTGAGIVDTMGLITGYVGRSANTTGSAPSAWVAAATAGSAPDWTLASNTVPASFAARALDHIGRINFVTCGNGMIEGSEGCDDGNTAAGDCCSTTCTVEPAANVCRGSAGSCDLPETCGGASTCPPNGFRPSGMVCRPNAGVCDVQETCTGGSAVCPSDGFGGAGIVCRPSAGICDRGEACTGSGPLCPADLFDTSGATCRVAVGMCDIAESCTGGTAACPADSFVADGTACVDTSVCNGDESCMGGACIAGTSLDCDDGDACTDDACDATSGCASTPIAGCGDGGTGVDGGIGADGGSGVDGGVTADGGPRPDGMVSSDGGSRDATVGFDAGPPRTRSGGCSCRTGSSGSGFGALGVVFAAVLVLFRRRRR